jgi:MoxR-like ATPase
MFREGGVFLADELDAADANVLLALNTALSSNHLYNPISGQRFTKHKDFVFLGAANTFGKGASNTYTGRNRLDAATLDRFTCVQVDYLEQIENAICPDELVANALRVIRGMVRDRGSSEVISYRAFAKCYTLHKTLEYSWKDTCAMVFASWSKDLLKDAQNVI